MIAIASFGILQSPQIEKVAECDRQLTFPFR